jgi:hypothetical protein
MIQARKKAKNTQSFREFPTEKERRILRERMNLLYNKKCDDAPGEEFLMLFIHNNDESAEMNVNFVSLRTVSPIKEVMS